MSITITSKNLKKEGGDSSSQKGDDNTTNDTKFNTDVSCSLENILINKEVENEAQSTTAMPQDLRKNDHTYLSNGPLNGKSIECKNAKTLFNKTALIRNCRITLEEEKGSTTTSTKNLRSSSLQITSIDGFFNRKRGRPPKNRFIEVYKNVS